MSNFNIKIISGTLFVTLFMFSLGGCGGKTANPVATYQPTDSGLSCSSLVSAMDETQSNIQRLIPETKKTGKNVALGTVGAILFFPALFFIDLGEAEKAEVEAYRNRYNHLGRLYQDKQCGKRVAIK